MVLLRAGPAIVSIIVAAVLVRPAVSEYLSQRRPLTEVNLRRAAAVTAEDAGYLLALAGLSEAGTVGTDPKETPALYRAALMRNPADGRAWIGLARSLRNTGAGREEIIHVLRRALILERSNPDVIWYAGVLALQEQEFAFGAKIFRRYLAVVPEDQGKVYALFRTLRAPTAFVIENLIPENPKSPAGYFDYLISNKLADEAREFWAWFGNMHPGKAAYVAYASFLIDQGEVPMALQVWNEFADTLELMGRGRKGDSILWNGGFDLPFENSGFDWRSLLKFAREFPTVAVYRGNIDAAQFLDGVTDGVPHRQIVLEEMLMLWLANNNPAFAPFIELFDDSGLAKDTAYQIIISNLYAFFDTQPRFGPDHQHLIDLLRAPALASPDSLEGQLEFIRTRWLAIIGEYLARLLGSLDLIKEEGRIIFPGAGETRVPTVERGARGVYEGEYPEYERFSRTE